MSRYLALEWDRAELRGIVAEVRGKRCTLERGFRTPLEAPPDGESPERPSATAIRRCLDSEGVRTRGIETLVAIGRSSVELRELVVSNVDDAELPDVVRQQAVRELSSVGEDTTLDFVPLDYADEESQSVVAAAVAEPFVAEVEQTCQQAKLEARRIGLRSFSSGWLLARRRGDRADVTMLVDPQSDEVDLTVIAHGQVVFSRTVRLANADSDEYESSLIAEIRRTQLAVHNTTVSESLTSICFWQGVSSDALRKRIDEELSLVVEDVDPLAEWELGPHAETDNRELLGRLASLFGMVEEEVFDGQQRFDFLHPRQPPEPQDHRWRWIAAAAVVAVIAGTIGFLGWQRLSALDKQISDLRRESAGLDRVIKRGAQQQQAAAVVGQWVDAEVIWLDQLRYLSVRFPPPQDAVLTRLEMARSASGSAGMDLYGMVRDASLVEPMENGLRSPRHEVRTKRGQQLAGDESYPWKFDTSLTVLPPTAGGEEAAEIATAWRTSSRQATAE